jgi:predicted dehydrogenase
VNAVKRIKIAQIGMAHDHAPEKFRAFRRFPELFDVVGICEPDHEALKRLGDQEAYTGAALLSEEELFRIPELDAVAVETDVPDLNKFALKCINRGIHIHMDKPAGEIMEEYETLMHEAEKKKLVVQMGYMYRYYPTLQYCVETARSGKLGSIFEIDAHMSTEHAAEYRRWMEQYQGGSMYIFGCHLIDLIVQIMGMPANVVPFNRKTLLQEANTWDSDLAVLEYPNAVCIVRINSVEINGFARRQFVVCGSKGTIEIKPLEAPAIIKETFLEDVKSIHIDCSRKLRMDAAPLDHRYDSQVIHFAKIIRGEAANPYSYQHDIDVHKATLLACGIKPGK